MEEDEVNGEDVLLPGQMCYDELLTNEENSQNEEVQNIVLDDQIGMDDIYKGITNSKLPKKVDKLVENLGVGHSEEPSLASKTPEKSSLNKSEQEEIKEDLEDVEEQNYEENLDQLDEIVENKEQEEINENEEESQEELEDIEITQESLEDEEQEDLEDEEKLDNVEKDENSEDIQEENQIDVDLNIQDDSHEYKIGSYKKVNMSEREEKKVEESKLKPFDYEDGVVVKTIDEVLHESMIPYTEHVVMDRALPRVEDGLKPVQRRILYSMLELGLTPDKQYRKSARIVGDCMGKYHPHGDRSVYDAMVRMSQDFSLRAPLVDGHGNFGSIDGDSAAAMRYTEAKLTPLAMELLRDLEKNTVHWSLNFDDTLKEPDMLPGRFPNLLVNGTSGIAVGVATNIPPHNLGEVINGVVAYIENNKITTAEMMKYIPAPDFPTGGIIIAGEELKNAYETGKGKIIVRAKVKLENSGDKQSLVITELPYQVNKSALLQKIAELKTDEKSIASYIGEIRDESDRNGMRAVLRIKKGGNPEKILEYLYKATQLEVSFGINMVAIASGKPKQLGLLDIISYYVEYQREVIVRRTKFDLDVAKDRAHIVEGLLIAIQNIDEVVRIIKKSATTTEAKQRLRDRFKLSEKQAQAILDMRLARLVNLEITKLEQELKELKELIEKLTAIYNSKRLQYSTVKTELIAIKNKFSNPRRSNITKAGAKEVKKVELKVEDEILSRDVLVAIAADNTLKSIPLKNYMMSTKDLTSTSNLSDVHLTELFTTTTNKALIFTNLGNVVKIDVSQIPESKWKGKGTQLKNICNKVLVDEYPVKVLEIPESLENKNLLFYTKQGLIKLSTYEDSVVNKLYYQGIKLKEDDELINVEVQNENSAVIMITKNAMALHFKLDDVPVQGRVSGGVKGINLDNGDSVIFAGQTEKTGAITVITDKGYGKKVPIGEYEQMARYRKGLRIIPLGETGKKLVFASFKKEPKSVAINKGTVLELLKDKNIGYDSRTSKGKQVVKGKFENVFIYED